MIEKKYLEIYLENGIYTLDSCMRPTFFNKALFLNTRLIFDKVFLNTLTKKLEWKKKIPEPFFENNLSNILFILCFPKNKNK